MAQANSKGAEVMAKDRGAEFAGVLVFSQDGKDVAEMPESGEVAISMRKGMKFHGDPEKALQSLAASFPGRSFTGKQQG
jgi:hypothetical protein